MRISTPRPAAAIQAAIFAATVLLAGAATAQDATAPAAPATPPELAITRTDGDWQTVCRSATEGPCFIRQVGKTAEGQEVLEVSVRRVEPQQTQQGTVEAIISVRVPLGVLLGAGLAIQIDASEPQTGGFAICAQEGCLLREPMPNTLVDAFRKGVTAKLSFSVPGQTEAQKIDATVSLRGFTAAYGALKP